MQVRFHANDNEPLALDLTRYDKGQRRVARLMTLATYGLIYLQQVTRAGNGMSPLGPHHPSPSSHGVGKSGDPTDARYEYKLSADDVADVFGG
jgi:hypothetical protein